MTADWSKNCDHDFKNLGSSLILSTKYEALDLSQ